MAINNLEMQPGTLELLSTPPEGGNPQHTQSDSILCHEHFLVAAPQALEEVLDGPICRGIVLAIQTTVQFELPEIAEEVHTAGMCLFEFAHVVLQVLWVYFERRVAFVDLVVVGAFAQVGLFDQQVLHRLYKYILQYKVNAGKGAIGSVWASAVTMGQAQACPIASQEAGIARNGKKH